MEIATRAQTISTIWIEERRKLLTASNFDIVCKRRANRDTSKLVKNILYARPLQTVPALEHGRLYEDEARKTLEEKVGIKIRKSGLIIDDELLYLGASPGGYCEDPIIYEYPIRNQ